MKLLVATPYYYPKVGGLENYAHELCKRLVSEYNYEILVVTSNHESHSEKREEVDGIQVFRLPSLVKVSNTPVNPFWVGHLRDAIASFQPNLVWGHMPVPFMADMAAIAAHIHGIPYMCVYHNDLIATNFGMAVGLKVYEKTLLQHTLKSSRVIINTSTVYRANSSVLKKVVDKIHVVSPGVDQNRFSKINKKRMSELKKRASDINLLFVSQLDKTHLHRGLPVLLKALKMLQKDSDIKYRLHVVGKGNYIDEYKKIAVELGLKQLVDFVGYVSNDELPTYYKFADVLVLPSTSTAEGFGMVMIEAGYMGTPVVASRIGGIPEVIEDNVTGLLCEAGDVKSLKDALWRVAHDKKLSDRLGSNLQTMVKKQFTWESQTKKLHTIISSIASL